MMDKEHRLFAHAKKFSPLTEEDWQASFPFFETLSFRKKEHLAQGGSPNHKIYFVTSGCLQQYFIDNRGISRTVQFAIEHWWIGDFLTFQQGQNSDFYIQAVENTEVCGISGENYGQLLEKFPVWEVYFRQIYQIAYGAALNRVKYLYGFSKEEIYFHFVEQFPEFVQRVPQYLIASFLGLTPEYVSEIRKNRY